MVKFVKIVLPFLPALAHALYEQDQSQHSMFNGWAKEGNADAIKRHLNKFEGDRMEFVSAGDHWEKQATHYAAEHGHADVLKMLRCGSETARNRETAPFGLR